MNNREREMLDRHITGNYGEDQFRDERPHGEHPTLGRCDCDDCQAFDRMEACDHDFEDFEKLAEGVYKCRTCGMVEDYRKAE